MFMLQDDNRQNCPINKLPVPLRLFVKSQCKTENWNKTNILQCPTCFFDVERTNQTTGVKQSLLKWSGDPRVEKTQVRNCRRTWTSALWLYLRPQGTWVHSFIIHRLYNWVSKGYSQQKVVSYFFSSESLFIEAELCVTELQADRLTVQTCAGVHGLPGCSAAGCRRTASSCAAPSQPTWQNQPNTVRTKVQTCEWFSLIATVQEPIHISRPAEVCAGNIKTLMWI